MTMFTRAMLATGCGRRCSDCDHRSERGSPDTIGARRTGPPSRLHRHTRRQRHRQSVRRDRASTPTRATVSSNAFPTGCPRAGCRRPRCPASKSACRCRCFTSRRTASMMGARSEHRSAAVWTFNGESAPVERTSGAASGCCERPWTLPGWQDAAGRFRATTRGGTTSTARPGRCSASSTRRRRRSRTTWRCPRTASLGILGSMSSPKEGKAGHRRHRRAGPQGAAIHDVLRDGAPAHHQSRRQRWSTPTSTI
mgnify:CR=1 FL=1